MNHRQYRHRTNVGREFPRRPVSFHAQQIPGAGLSYAELMQVQVLYLGMLKDVAGHERETVQLHSGARLDELMNHLLERVPKLADFRSAIALAVNCEYSDSSVILRDNDEVALIPPVSGGAADDSSSGTALPLAAEHARLVCEPSDTESILRAFKRPEDGAIVTFDGIVRNHSRGRRTLFLEYTAYEVMALRQMEELAQTALKKFAIRDLRIEHRLGHLEIGETSVYIAVASAHRAPAFDACRWLIDTLKTTVPIWKQEYFEDGAVWADGEAFPPQIPRATASASK